MNLTGKHILSVSQFTLEDLFALFQSANLLEPVAQGLMQTQLLSGAILANLFFEASTRTRISFHSAFARLGGSVCDTTGFSFSSISKGESLEDTARVISGYADAIVIRHPDKGSAQQFSRYAQVPTINGGDGPGEHPTQALLDIYTIYKIYANKTHDLSGLTIAMSGDLKYGRTVHSLAKLLCLFSKLTFHFIAPKSLQMPENILEELRQAGHTVKIFTRPEEGLINADVLYATRIQRERFTEEQFEQTKSELFSINKTLIHQYAKENIILLHPLPRDSREGAFDLSNDLDPDRRLKIFEQTDNGIPVRMALFAHVLGVANYIGKDFRPTTWKKRV